MNYDFSEREVLPHNKVKATAEFMTRDLLKTIEEKMPSFSKGQMKIANYILENYDKAAYITAAKLGAIVNVSESTIVRFAYELEFDGYHAMQLALRELIRTNLTSFERMEVANDLMKENNVLDKVLATDIDRIKHTLEEIDRNAFDCAVRKIASARRIYVIGLRSASLIAGFLARNFSMIFDSVVLIQSTSGSEVFENIMQIGPEDVLIAVSFPRYSKRVIKAVEFASKAGANVISITDRDASPIAEYADQLLVAKSDMASFVDSLVAPLSLVNAIIASVSLLRKDEVEQRLRKLEEIWDEYDVYDKQG